MTEEQINILTIWIIVPSFVVVILLTLMSVLDTPHRTLRRRQERQLAQLDEAIRAISHAEPTLDWMRFKDVSKQELLDGLAKHGWYYVDQEIRGNHWMLRLSRDRAHRPATTGAGPRQRLRDELKRAEVDIDGTYMVDTAMYAEVSRRELLQLAREAGWYEVRPGRDGECILAPIGSEAAEIPQSFLQGPSLTELRQNPQVRHRANILESRMGFDPLSDATANHVRQRYNHYLKILQRNLGIGILYATIAVIALSVGLATFEADDGTGRWTSLAIAWIMGMLFIVSMAKLRMNSRQRHREIGDFFEAYQQLKQVHEGILPPRSDLKPPH